MSERVPNGRTRAGLLRLQDRLRQASGPARDLDHLLFEQVAAGGPFRRYTASLDSALALAEEALPGCGWDIGSPARPSGGQPWASVWPWGLSERRDENHRNGATPELALLDALVGALIGRLPPDLSLSAEMEVLAEAAVPADRPAGAEG